MSVNSGDPTAVQALLDQLRSSQAWQDALANQSTEPPPPPVEPRTSSTPSVASLLSQLQTPNPPLPPVEHSSAPYTSQAQTISTLSHPSSFPSLPASAESPLPLPTHRLASTSQNGDIKSYTFQQALPVLAQLSEDPSVIDTFIKLKQEQDDLERKLWDERASIQKKYEDKLKVAQTKASLIGGGISKHETEMMSTAYERELAKFDRERVLPAWDGLVTIQQNALARVGVPTMFPTTSRPTRERQQKVMQVLEAASNPD